MGMNSESVAFNVNPGNQVPAFPVPTPGIDPTLAMLGYTAEPGVKAPVPVMQEAALPNFAAFVEWPKIARLNRDIVITEKIDGTNAQVWIRTHAEMDADNKAGLGLGQWVDSPAGLVYVIAGSRTKYITPTDDNHGFARWVFGNLETVSKLGPGRHFGEWWGSGIQRGYGLQKGEKRFSLFNTHRWVEVKDALSPQAAGKQVAPAGIYVVPTLYSGMFNQSETIWACEDLRKQGSKAAPGFMKPEGIIVYHTHARVSFKVTLEKDAEHKGTNR